MQPVAVPTLDELARDPLCAMGLPMPTLAALQAQIAAAQGALAAAMSSASSQAVGLRAVETAAADGRPDRMLTIDEASARLRKGRQWLYRNAARLPFVRRISRKSLLCSEAGLNAYLAAKPALRHNGGYERQRPVGKGLGQTAAKPHGADENPSREGKDIAARAGRNGTRGLPQNLP
jgi:hypothetical protein